MSFQWVCAAGENYLSVGKSLNPHGGIGSLEYRNLYSNYFGYEDRRRQVFGHLWTRELSRELNFLNVDAYANKPPLNARRFYAGQLHGSSHFKSR
jgi:hypothetical protein